jgi:LysR family hydrogen peroxide-inducible transcriptional activator
MRITPVDRATSGEVPSRISDSGGVSRRESAVELRQLKAFVALVERGSITAAANAMGFAQSTMSEALSSLEHAMGAPLFLRRRGSQELVLTAAGNALLPHARSVLDLIDDAHAAVANATRGARARVAIATNESVSTYVLGTQLAALRRQWPNTAFEVTVMMCADVRAGVERGEYDLGVMLRPDDDSTATSVAERTIIPAAVPLVIFAQRSHPLAHRDSVRRGALVDHPLYISDAAGDLHVLVRRYLERDGLPVPHIRSTGSVESVKRSVLTDPLAIGVLPAYALAEELRDEHVVALRMHPTPPRMRLEALTSATRAQHPATRQLIDAVAAACAPAACTRVG